MNNLIQILKEKNNEVIVEATEAIKHSHSRHNGSERLEKTEQLLKRLYALTLQSVEEKNVAPMIEYVEKIPRERFSHGYDIYELQFAFNILEEAIWNRILRELSPIAFAKALGMISTVLGIGKDTMARSYVSLASKKMTPYIDYKILFEGMESE
jgi:hypothetical protein